MATVVFMGTPDFAVPTLQSLIRHHELIGVVTQPDRPAGRGTQVRMSPVKMVALEQGIPVFQPEKLRRPEAVEHLRAWQADFFIVAAFGQILPQSVLDMPRYGCINVHASLLPRWRGAAPIHAAIRAGDAETGITIMQMDAGLDTGAILTMRATPIAPDETTHTLHDRLALIGSELLIETLPAVLAGTIQPQPQDNALATFAPQISKEEGLINWHDPADAIERLIRAFTPWPGTFTHWNGKVLKIHSGRIAAGSAAPGQVVRHSDGIAIGTGSGLYIPAEVQLEGKNRVSIESFTNGHPHFVGSSLQASQ
jgi:methionyl-tRNA formyltransferase